MRKFISIIAVILILQLLLLTGAFAQSQTNDSGKASGTTVSIASTSITIKDLSTYLGSDYSTAKAINNKGQIIGTYNQCHGFLLDNGKVTDLGAGVYPNDVNDNGQIVGSYSIMGINHAFLWENGTLKDLGILGGTDYVQCHGSEAYKINNNGQIVGRSTSSDDKYHAFLWENGVMKDLGIGWAYSINDKGQVVGTYDNNPNHAFLWENGVVTSLHGSNYYSAALDINENGLIVGWADNDEGFSKAFLFSGYGDDLGTLVSGSNIESWAFAINNNGKIVGQSALAWGSFADVHAFLLNNDRMVDLGTLGGKNSSASDINNNDQIVGTASGSDGTSHAVIWEDSDSPSPTQANYGDLNDDGKVNSADASILKRVILRTYTGTYDEINADMNSDKKINSTDYSLLKRKILEIS